MRIVDVKVHLVPTPAMPPYRWRAGLPGSGPAGVGAVLRVVTDEGVEGIATTHRGTIVADLVDRRLRDELIGQNPLQVRRCTAASSCTRTCAWPSPTPPTTSRWS